MTTRVTEFAGNRLHPSASPLFGASAIVANAAAVAVLTPAAGRKAYLAGFRVSGLGATGALEVLVTITGLEGGTITYGYNFVTGAGVGNPILEPSLPFAFPGSAVGQAITVSCAAGGAGNVGNHAVAWGYQI